MYNGYRLKINNEIVPNSYISKGSFQSSEEYRVLRTWTDARHIDHEDVSSRKRFVCSFSFREHLSDEHSEFARLITQRTATIDYYDDDTDTYKKAVCRIEAPAWSHANIVGDQILYNACPIAIREY